MKSDSSPRTLPNARLDSDGHVNLQSRVPAKLASVVRKLADDEGRPVSNWIQKILRDAVERSA
ncbi:hypothetical protein ACFLRO_00530 [Bacteroidota bacterium]